jgi:hypothetical protein
MHLSALNHFSIIDLARWRICELLQPSKIYPEACSAMRAVAAVTAAAGCRRQPNLCLLLCVCQLRAYLLLLPPP